MPASKSLTTRRCSPRRTGSTASTCGTARLPCSKVRRARSEVQAMVEWTPRTRLGKLVTEGMITTMSDALKTRLPLREAEIVDILVPDLVDEVLDVNMVQRMTDSGRRVRFATAVVVANQDGLIG